MGTAKIEGLSSVSSLVKSPIRDMVPSKKKTNSSGKKSAKTRRYVEAEPVVKNLNFTHAATTKRKQLKTDSKELEFYKQMLTKVGSKMKVAPPVGVKEQTERKTTIFKTWTATRNSFLQIGQQAGAECWSY